MLKSPLRYLFVMILLTVSAFPAFAQDDVSLVAFSDATYGIEGIRPEGWTDASPGIQARRNSEGDPTLIGMQAVPLSIESLWPALLPQLGLDEVPDSTGTHTGSGFTWTLYKVDAGQLQVDLALVEESGTSYIVLLQSLADEYDALHESIFLPVLDSLAPLVEDDLPYLAEDVTFDNGDVTLAGTLTLPDAAGPHPAVVLMTGTGPQNRDEIITPAFPVFRRIADYLTQQGIAVLRYDDRGVGESEGDYDATSIYDFAADGGAAVAYLKSRSDINPDQVGVLGHSEGGIYASILGADPESGVDFIISMAGTAVNGAELLVEQNRLIFEAEDASDELLQMQLDYLDTMIPLAIARDWDTVRSLTYDYGLAQWEVVSEEERAQLGVADAETFAQRVADRQIQGYANESFATLLEYDPAEGWAQTSVPVLGIFGGLDIQVPDEQNAGPMEAALTEAGNEDFTIVVIDKANHLFQEAERGTIDEYFELPGEFEASFLPLISDWIKERVDLVA